MLASSDGTLVVSIASGAVPFGSGNASPLVQALAPQTGSLTFATRAGDETGYRLWHYRPESAPEPILTLESRNHYIESAAITRDGSRIAYSVLVWPPGDADGWYEQLWVVNVDGSNNRLVADHTGEAIVDPGPFRLAPVGWSRDRSTIYMVTNTDSEATPTGLYSVNVATGAISKANTPEETLWRATVSPSGARLAYYSFQWVPVEGQFPEPGPPFAIKLVELSSGNTVAVWESDTEQVSDPVWSPDGSAIAFSRSRNTIAVVNLVDGSQTSVLAGGAQDWLRPRVWLSDGRVVYTTGAFGDQLFSIRLDGSSPRFIDEVERVSVLGEVP